jgi:hypothetical protein
VSRCLDQIRVGRVFLCPASCLARIAGRILRPRPGVWLPVTRGGHGSGGRGNGRRFHFHPARPASPFRGQP